MSEVTMSQVISRDGPFLSWGGRLPSASRRPLRS